MAARDLQSHSHAHPKVTLVSIATALFEAEKSLWKLAPGGRIDDLGLSEVGFQVLKHGNTVNLIHGYFSNFESRKCCMNLVAGQRLFSSLRIVKSNQQDAHLEEGVFEKECSSIQPTEVLTEQEYRLFRHCVLTSRFPLLSVPSLPPDHTATDNPERPKSAVSKHSLADSISICSEIEEFDTSIIPTETLVDLVRRLFGLNPPRARQFEKLILAQYGRKNDAKILAEELAGRLTLLENNRNPFYHPSNFHNRATYEAWKQNERQQISDLFEKFWTTALPPVKQSLKNSGTEHSDYRFLIKRLISYEGGLHLDTRTAHGSSIYLPVSSASTRLLREYALRYGIGDVYHKVVHLEYLSEHFENEVWFICHTSNLVSSILDFLPENLNKAVMVQKELSILTKSVDRLQGQCKNSLTHIHRLFLDTCIPLGIDALVDLLSKSLLLKSRISRKKPDDLGDLLFSYAQENFQTAYEQHKLLAFTDLNLDPIMLNLVLTSIRDQVNDYNMRYSVCFLRFFDLGRMSASAFYSFLLEDIRELCLSKRDQRLPNKLDLSMLSLAYRLNQLDQDWRNYISVHEQKWRLFFYEEVCHWMNVLCRHSIKLVQQAAAKDKFKVSALKYSSGTNSARSTSTVSSRSLTPSAHSAFNAVKPHAPQHEPILETSKESASDHHGDVMVTVDCEDSDEEEMVDDEGHLYPDIIVDSWQSMSWQSASVDFKNENMSSLVSPHLLPENVEAKDSSHVILVASTSNAVTDDQVTDDTHSVERQLLVSGSVIDVTVILNRCLFTMEALCDMLLPCQHHKVKLMPKNDEHDFDIFAYCSSMGQLLVNNLYKIMKEVIFVYGDNILCMDLCGIYSGIAKTLVGAHLVEHLKESHDHLWGCRHMTKGQKDCFEYVNKRSLFLADKFEPIVQEMCTRINNVHQLSSVIGQFFYKAKKISKHFLGIDNQSEEEQHLDECQNHLRDIHDGLLQVLSHRVHLFFAEAYHLLLHLSVSFVTVDDRLLPVIQFLDNHLSSVQEWLYPNSFLLFAQSLWNNMIRTIKVEVIDLRELSEGQDEKVQVILQSIIIFLRLFSRFVGHGKVLDILTMKVESVSFWLHLFTLSTPKLIDVYEVLSVQNPGIPESWKLTSKQVKWIRDELHGNKKGFCGQYLKQWLKENMKEIRSLSLDNDASLFSDAEMFAQHLLNCGLMVPMETYITPPSSTHTAPYPDIVCYSQQSIPFISTIRRSSDQSDLSSSSTRSSTLGDPIRETTPDYQLDLSMTYSSHGDLYMFHDSVRHFYHFRSLGLEDMYSSTSSDGSVSNQSHGATQMELYHQKELTPELLLGVIVTRCRTDPLAKDFLIEFPLEQARRHSWLIAHKQPLLLGCLNW
ncbi:hypothetical protein CAPTEDRAFT_228488 [Capitella teleta]|uniref:MHD2 domain-containing protein n=1 Tax=Capitella teleta TaxID=283909 RepID=R7TEA3_CAPTE|nr:hypothetical protein CAPTEDRAFT_228488 [Capitella teleta]|eukprot:ELT92064.1 hypothetical protein CAPTEDRAFT_228488 [Capitella teleta]